jgi:hypothetical protein
MKSIHLDVLCAMTTLALACSSSDGGSPQGSDGSGSDGSSGVTAGGAATRGQDDAVVVDAGDNTTPFLGTWTGDFSTNENCPTTIPTMSSRADTLVITASTAEAGTGIISVLTENGCIFDYAVNGYTATALPNQVCRKTKDGSVTEYLAVLSRTLTLGGGESNEIGSVTITKNGVPCSDTEQGTYVR